MDDAVLAPLFARLEKDDQQAMQELYEYARNPLVRFFWRLVRRSDPIEDLVQGTFLRLWQYRGRFRGEGQARGYVYRVALNEWHNTMSRESKRREIEEGIKREPVSRIAPSADHIVQSEETRRRVREAIDELPEAQREAFVLHRFEGLSCREIATILGRSQKTVESRLRLALDKLTYKLSIAEGMT